ncbi:endonuclease III [Blochmannia endosymbiont of Camponotus (Colobopsis) obliquus]|uniref:endonuclease III n=1 Tax=Blochmannia endosymbiont of Camponotus (Colobopsis) obliquus TaxID=1505597 RepID=UPI00061A70BB|nr:endonuclease III [Blochmannia endosymbiont of Camponotus (Colobopsis) obliquus]AKC60531.1 endonuclease III [Blochmannia endosymbiont of Camponotus (Colobopsis) obliquus]
MNYIKRYQILYRFYINNPNPTTELIYHSAFELLIAVILSAQSTDRQVNKVTNVLFSLASSPQLMLHLGQDKLKKCIKSVGLYNKKSENIIKTCQLLVNKYNSTIPENRDALENFPGVGRKTANIILNTIFGWSTIAVDTHVFRLCNRTHFALGNSVKTVENKLLILVPVEFKNKCHYWMVMHGRYVCVAKNPQCHICYIADLCKKNLTVKKNCF